MLHSNPVAELTDLSPAVATAGQGDVELTLQGSGFIRESTVVFDGVSIPTRWESTTCLHATLPEYLLGRPGNFSIYVTNPRPLRITDWLHQDERSNPAYFIVRFA
jgi:hypothetical protein